MLNRRGFLAVMASAPIAGAFALKAAGPQLALHPRAFEMAAAPLTDTFKAGETFTISGNYVVNP